MKQTEVQKCIAEVMETEKRSLFCYACYYLGDADEAHDMLQDLYLSLCGTTGIVQNTRNLKNYIFRALYNNCKAAMKRKQNICISSIDSTDVSKSICLEDNSNGTWLVNFPQCGEKEDIAEISINEEDLKTIPVMNAIVNEQIKAEFGD